MTEENERGPTSAEIKLNDIQVSKQKRREQAIAFVKKYVLKYTISPIDVWGGDKETALSLMQTLAKQYDIDPADVYDFEYIIVRARELEGR
jgi:aspartyl aminopeptidase